VQVNETKVELGSRRDSKCERPGTARLSHCSASEHDCCNILMLLVSTSLRRAAHSASGEIG
jgi:hypothetical protein